MFHFLATLGIVEYKHQLTLGMSFQQVMLRSLVMKPLAEVTIKRPWKPAF